MDNYSSMTAPDSKSLVRAIEQQLAVAGAPLSGNPSLLFFKKNARSALELLQGAPLYPLQERGTCSPGLTLRSLSVPRVPTALLERFSSPPSLIRFGMLRNLFIR